MTGMTYNSRMRLLLVIAFGGAAAIGLALGFAERWLGDGPYQWVMVPLAALMFVLVFVLGWLWWKPLDDVQKQAHMASWYWGAMAGAVAFILWLVAQNLHHSDYGRGAGTMFLIQGGGFALCYAYWWLRGRAGAHE